MQSQFGVVRIARIALGRCALGCSSPRMAIGDVRIHEITVCARVAKWAEALFLQHPEWGYTRCEIEESKGIKRKRSDLRFYGQRERLVLAGEREKLVDELYWETANHFRQIRIVEIQKQEQRAKPRGANIVAAGIPAGRRAGLPSPADRTAHKPKCLEVLAPHKSIHVSFRAAGMRPSTSGTDA